MSIIKKKAQLDCGKIEIGCQSQGGMQTGRLGDVTMNIFLKGLMSLLEVLSMLTKSTVSGKIILPGAHKHSAGMTLFPCQCCHSRRSKMF